MSVEIQLVSRECESAIGDERDAKEMLRKAFKVAKKHWMILDPNIQLKGALNAVLTKMGDDHPDRKRLEQEIHLLAAFNAFIAAARQGLRVSPPELPEGFEALGINPLWLEDDNAQT